MKSKKCIILFLTALLLLFLLFPSSAFQGAKSGLLLWFYTVLPSLLPFMIVSNVIIKLEITSYITALCYPILHALLKVSKNGCYPIVIGMLSGYPLGAKTCADLVKQNDISLEEGQYLLSFCNNPSPMFITCYVAEQCLKMPHLRYFLLGNVLFCALLNSLIYRKFQMKQQKKQCFSQQLTDQENQIIPSAQKKNSAAKMPKENLSLLQAFDYAIMNSFEVLVKIGGYIILFSLMAQIIFNLSYIPLLIKMFFTSVLEITTGINMLSTASISSYTKIVLTITITAFGGLSSLIQTKSVIASSGLSTKIYLYNKITHMILTFFFALLFLHIV